MAIRIFDPSMGMCAQGDVLIAPLPNGVSISANATEMPLKNGMLVIAEGEVTGHHHAFRYGLQGVAHFRDDGLARDMTAAYEAKAGTVRLYRDDATLAALVKKNLVTDGSLCIGFLHVEAGAPPLTHDEHDAIQFPPGDYYVCGKREFNAGAARKVQD